LLVELSPEQSEWGFEALVELSHERGEWGLFNTIENKRSAVMSES
jgi:hypothetical protein